jgi:hypothetical protein
VSREALLIDKQRFETSFNATQRGQSSGNARTNHNHLPVAFGRQSAASE